MGWPCVRGWAMSGTSIGVYAHPAPVAPRGMSRPWAACTGRPRTRACLRIIPTRRREGMSAKTPRKPRVRAVSASCPPWDATAHITPGGAQAQHGTVYAPTPAGVAQMSPRNPPARPRATSDELGRRDSSPALPQATNAAKGCIGRESFITARNRMQWCAFAKAPLWPLPPVHPAEGR
jgi:hypothetical protein